MLNLLHICSDYSNQGLYKNMINHIGKSDVNQVVFVPVRSQEELNIYNIEGNSKIKIIYKYILKKYHRFLYHLKINSVAKKISESTDIKSFNLVHAHFLFSDGGVALKFKEKQDIPYIVSVRNTDVNVFFKYMFFLRKKGVRILSEASKVVFLNEAYKDFVIDKYVPANIKQIIAVKSMVIPNGLDDFWLKNKADKPKVNEDKIKVLYVGDFTTNKNVPLIIESVKQLSKQGFNISLTLVGGGGNGEEEVLTLLKVTDKDLVSFLGRTSNKEELLEIYKNHNVFVMPSFKETFGMVYLEAMSQGLPIIFSKGQGVDGYFKINEPGFSVNPNDIEDLKEKIVKCHSNLAQLSLNSLFHIDNFSWEEVSNKLVNEYKLASNN